MKKKLIVKKITIAALNQDDMHEVNGGRPTVGAQCSTACTYLWCGGQNDRTEAGGIWTCFGCIPAN
jgi:hypothetical protein